MSPRHLRIATLALGGVAVAGSAGALGFGRIPDSLPFGQALDLSVPLRLDAGETVAQSCIHAEVRVGEQRVPAEALAVSLESLGGQTELRLRSPVVVREPLVSVDLSVGCHGGVSRRFVLLADPGARRPGARPLPASRAAPPDEQRTAPPRPVASRDASPLGTRAEASARPSPAAPQPPRAQPPGLLQAVAATTSAPQPAPSPAAGAIEAAGTASALRVAQLEASLNQVRDEAERQRATVELMRSRLAQADDQSRLQNLLLGMLALLAVAVTWLGWRLRVLQRERPSARLQGARAAEDAAVAAPARAAPQLAPTHGLVALGAALGGPGPLATLSPPPEDATVQSRPASVDDLIDLEQQTDFFVALGEEDSAVELLNAHLHRTEAPSPLPCLRLLAMYRSRGQREAYERLGRRFGQRFDATAPAWEADTEHGRGLLDYPQVLAVLQSRWLRPLQAMAELETLLLCRRAGELFDLPAYRDMLMLYAVARELHRRAVDAAAGIDVLLPLDEPPDGTRVAPPIIDGGPGRSFGQDLQDMPAGKLGSRVDLDLSEPAPALRATLRGV